MKTTFQGVLLEVGGEIAQGLDRLMRKYGFMVRYAFKRLLESGTKVGELERILAAETGLPLRYAKDAVAEAKQLIIGQKVLVKEHWQLWQRREKKTAARIHKIARQDPTSRKLPGLRSKLEKQQRKAAFYQQHAEQSTFPPVIFGSRELYLSQFKEGVNQAAWRQEWDDARNGRLAARGDRTKKGNPLLRIHEQDGAWRLEISLDHGEVHGKSIRYDKLTVPLYVPRKVSKTTGAINGRDYVALLHQAIERGDPYQVEILRKRGVYHVHVTVEEMPAKLVTYPVNGWVGMDTNPTLLALCHVRADGNPQAFQCYREGQLYDARSQRRDWLTGNLARQVVGYAKKRGAGLVMEDLRFVKDQEVSTKFRRITHQFVYRKVLVAVEREAKREGVEVRKVHPAYTSVIGRLKYQPQYGISVHESAALVIARRGGLKIRRENVPKPIKDWLVAKQTFNEAAYRKRDWGIWNQAKKLIEKTLQGKGGSLVSWLDQRKGLLQG